MKNGQNLQLHFPMINKKLPFQKGNGEFEVTQIQFIFGNILKFIT